MTVESDKRDKYKRNVGKVLVDGVDANLEQVRHGTTRRTRWNSQNGIAPFTHGRKTMLVRRSGASGETTILKLLGIFARSRGTISPGIE